MLLNICVCGMNRNFKIKYLLTLYMSLLSLLIIFGHTFDQVIIFLQILGSSLFIILLSSEKQIQQDVNP